MFGYVIPDKMNMFVKDYYNYKAYYCGFCKRIGKDLGQFMRFSTNYDMVFLDMFCHSLLGVEPKYNDEPCILSPKKKTIVKGDELTDMIVDINTLLMYYKLVDDKEDSKKANVGKKLTKVLVVDSKYKKAKAKYPQIDELYSKEYSRLRQMEKEKTASLDAFADPFANMLKQTIKFILGDKSNEYIEDLMYYLGKWVYFIDAVDDVEKDFEKGEFNPFFVVYEYQSKDKFFEDRLEEMTFLLKSCYNKIIELFKNIDLKINEGAITNILWYGILFRTEDILGRKDKCKKIRI